MRIRLTAIIATAGLAALTLAAIDGFTIKRAPKVGDTHKYNEVVKFDMQGQEYEFSATMTEKITKVEDNGNFSESADSTDAKLNGMELPGGAGVSAFTRVLNPKGELVEVKADNVDGNMYRFAAIDLFIVPDAAVKVGDTWKYDVKEDAKTGMVAGKASYTLVGEEKIGSVDTYKIKYSVKENGTDAASNEGTVWISKANGSLVKNDSKWTNVPVPGAPAPITGQVTITLVQ